jgi:hypothetical protein
VLAVLALLALLLAGSRTVTLRTATADTPNQNPVATLKPGQQACEGPLTGHGSSRAVGLWGAGGGAALTVIVRDAGAQAVLASGRRRATATEREYQVRLDRRVPGGRPVRICVADEGSPFGLAGSTASAPDLIATGLPPGQRFSLVLLSDGDRSLLASLSLAFSRASLWRPSWVGPWTFWVLTIAVATMFGLAVVAVVRADAEDGPPARSDRNDPEAPDAPPPWDRSEAGQDRPQPVP